MTRIERLRALLNQYGCSVDDFEPGSEEDLRPWFDAGECDEWCCITRHNDTYYFYPRFGTEDGAMERAVEFIDDSLYDELPVAVVNLETGERLVADLQVAWRMEVPSGPDLR